jgi:DNA-binding transcriptional LysR family regulator
MTKDLEVRHCRVLLAVRDAGGVGAAARALGIAQSTVSETLLSLERLLGAPVTMRRPGRDATLTTTAEALVPHARLLVAASAAGLAAAAERGHGAIRFGAVESISSFLLPGPLGAFRQMWPQVEVQIEIGLCADLRGRVARAELDAALTVEGAAAGGDADELSPIQLRLVVSPNNALAAIVATRDDLSMRTLLLADPEGAFNGLLRSWLSGTNIPLRLESAGSIDGVKRGVLHGDGIGVLPDYSVTEELATGTLVALNVKEPLPPIALKLTMLNAPEEGSPLDGLIAQLVASLPPKAAQFAR